MCHNDDCHYSVHPDAVLMGPVRGVTYMLVYGFLSVALGITFRLNVPWVLSVPLSAVVRLLGQWLYIMVTSWVTRENLIELLVTNAQTLLVRFYCIHTRCMYILNNNVTRRIIWAHGWVVQALRHSVELLSLCFPCWQ